MFVDMQENCNQLLIFKKKILQKAQIAPKGTSNMLDASYLCRHASYLHVYVNMRDKYWI